MPSYRLIFAVHSLHPGQQPPAVMDTAAAVVGSHGFVEAKDLTVVKRGGVPTPELVLRFTLEGEGTHGLAKQVAHDVEEALAEVAVTGNYRTLLRMGGKWIPLGAD